MNGKNRAYLSSTKHNSLEVTVSILKVRDGKGHKRNLLDFAEASNRYKLGREGVKAQEVLKKHFLEKGNATELEEVV